MLDDLTIKIIGVGNLTLPKSVYAPTSPHQTESTFMHEILSKIAYTVVYVHIAVKPISLITTPIILGKSYGTYGI